MAAADKVKIYDKFLKNQADDIISLSTAGLKVALATEASNAASLTLEFYTQITNALPTASGYTIGGQTIANVTVTEAGGIITLDGDDMSWTATGGSIAARYAIIYDDVAVGKPLVGFVLLDSAPDDLTAIDTQEFIIEWHANGILRFSADNT